MSSMYSRIEEKLKAAFSPEFLDVIDESHPTRRRNATRKHILKSLLSHVTSTVCDFFNVTAQLMKP